MIGRASLVDAMGYAMAEPQLFKQFYLSVMFITATTTVHAIFVAFAAVVFRQTATRVWGPIRFLRDVFVLVVLSLWLMAAHIIEIAMWAMLYLRLELFTSFEGALYFSAVSYTTLGFGDVLLPEAWRLLSGATAASGLLLFGLSAAFLIETTAKLRMGGDHV